VYSPEAVPVFLSTLPTLHGWVATTEALIKHHHWVALAWPPNPELVDGERLLDAERFDQHRAPVH
jgi:hypothetical protein